MAIARLDYPHAVIKMQIESAPEQKWRVNACQKEPWTAAWLDSLPTNATFWDIGANVGSYALIAIARGLRVVAVEPGYENVRKLRHNLALNDWLDRAFVYDCALGAAPAWAWLHYSDLAPGAASHAINASPRKISFHMQPIRLRPLDDLIEETSTATPGPHYLKIDVDGGEMAVLDGAAGFLSRSDLLGVMMEARAGEQEKEVRERMASHGLTLKGRWDQRDGKSIGEVVYLHFVRA